MLRKIQCIDHEFAQRNLLVEISVTNVILDTETTRLMAL
jgi:hypothetical protein